MPNRALGPDTITRFLASKQLAVTLFFLLCIVLIPQTLMETRSASAGWLSRILLGCMAVNLLVCTLRGIRTLPKPVLLVHAGVLISLIGADITSFGYVATVNIYEGTSVNAAYRWDIEQDMPLGFDLHVVRINEKYYPVPVRLGVLKDGEKRRIEELKTGESFSLGEYTVRADSLQLPEAELSLSVFRDGRLIGTTDTTGAGKVAPDFPYDFRLTAFKNPVYDRVWAEIMLTRGGEVVAKGTTEVNSPFKWNGLTFFFTLIERDPDGFPFAGIQIVRDPGAPVVYAGFAVIMAGALLWMYRKAVAPRTAR